MFYEVLDVLINMFIGWYNFLNNFYIADLPFSLMHMLLGFIVLATVYNFVFRGFDSFASLSGIATLRASMKRSRDMDHSARQKQLTKGTDNNMSKKRS